jgi:hypothetical protein
VGGISNQKMHENIKSSALNVSYSSNDPQRKFFNLVECTLETEIKEQFRDQFVVRRPQ